MAIMSCPYPQCDERNPGVGQATDCSCPLHKPVARCSCGMANRVEARFCRSCRKPLSGPALRETGELHPGPVVQSAIPGHFRQPPVSACGWLFLHTREGRVLRFAPGGTEAFEAGRLTAPAAGLNRGVMIDVPAGTQERPRGWTWVVATPSAVEALSVATGQSHLVYEARREEQVSAIRNESEILGMRGIASHGRMVAFGVSTSMETRNMVGLNLGEDRPPEILLTLSGRSVAGPATCGGRFALCTERQAGLYERSTGRAVVDFPRNFVPMLERDSEDVSLAPGSLPVFFKDAAPSRTLLVVGRRGGRVGLLTLDFNNPQNAHFRELPRGSSVSSQPGGTTCLCTQDTIEVFGTRPSRHTGFSLRSWMPASIAGPLISWFDYDPFPEKQHVGMGWNERRSQIVFNAPECNPDTFFGTHLVGADLAICYFAREAEGSQALLKTATSSLLRDV